MTNKPMALAVLAVVAAIVSLQLGTSLAKSIFTEMSALGVTTLRLWFAAAIMLVVMRPWRTRLTRASLRPLACYGVALAAMNVCFYLAVARLPIGLAIAIEFTGPLGVAAFTSRRAKDLIWVGLAVAGLLLISPWADVIGHSGTAGTAGIDPLGVLYALGAAISWAAYIVAGQSAGQHLGGGASALGMCLAALVVAPLGIILVGPALWAPHVFPQIIGVAVLASVVAYGLEMYALTRIPQRVFGVMMSLEPAAGALIAMVALGELLTPLQWLAIVLVVGASIGVTASSRQRKRADATQQPPVSSPGDGHKGAPKPQTDPV